MEGEETPYPFPVPRNPKGEVLARRRKADELIFTLLEGPEVWEALNEKLTS